MNYHQTTSSQSPPNLSEQKSIRLINGFDYEKLDTDVRMVIQQHTSEIKNLMRRTTQEIIEIGQKLTYVKAQLGHGNFRIWLKAEFDWSVPTANRFMQVAENFKCINLRDLNIAASALYLLASPSTPQEARTEALKRATSGENITYTKAKTIVSDYKKAIKPKSQQPVSFDTDIKNTSGDLIKSIKQEVNETNSVQDLHVIQSGNKVDTETDLLSIQNSVFYSESKDTLAVSSLERNGKQVEDTAVIPFSTVSQTVVSEKILDIVIPEIDMRIKELSRENLVQLALYILHFAKVSLDESDWLAIIRAVNKT
jgi:gas vesicle protein